MQDALSQTRLFVEIVFFLEQALPETILKLLHKNIFGFKKADERAYDIWLLRFFVF